MREADHAHIPMTHTTRSATHAEPPATRRRVSGGCWFCFNRKGGKTYAYSEHDCDKSKELNCLPILAF